MIRTAPGWARSLAAGPALALGLALVSSGGAGAAQLEGVRFSERLETRGAPLRLHRVALLRWKYVLKVYVAGLYLGEGVAPERALADVPRRLEIEYFHAIDREGFADATREGIARNVEPGRYAALRPSIERLNRLYLDVQPGDRYALTYVPGAGTELAHNGVPLGVVEGDDFARAVFAIWLGDDPIDRSLRRQLLGLE